MHLRALLIAAFLLVPVAALADLAPPPGYQEQCTIERVQQAGELCQLCTGAYHGDRDYCERELAGQGYEHRCRTRGASTWREVWCRANADGVDEGSAAAALELNEAAPSEAAPTDEAPEVETTPGAEAAPGDEAAPGEETTVPADPPARTRGCAAAGQPPAPALAFLLFGLVALRRRRS